MGSTLMNWANLWALQIGPVGSNTSPGGHSNGLHPLMGSPDGAHSGLLPKEAPGGDGGFPWKLHKKPSTKNTTNENA